MPDSSTTTIPVDGDLLAAVLSPYKENCRYLKNLVVEPSDGSNGHLAIARGTFEIPESWYIDETGHFNAIEFNICYNQIIYTLMAQCVVSKLVPGLSDMTIDEYKRRQLPCVLIAKFSSAFKKPMMAQRFDGWVSIDSVGVRKKMLLVKTRCGFSDEGGGLSEGDVTLAITLGPLPPDS